jgi:hypothetical protein
MASCARCTAGCTWLRWASQGESCGSCPARRMNTTISRAAAWTTGAPPIRSTTWSARSMPEVMPALDRTGPSSTKRRSSSTRARGASRRSRSTRVWWVVQARPSRHRERHRAEARRRGGASPGVRSRPSSASPSATRRGRPPGCCRTLSFPGSARYRAARSARLAPAAAPVASVGGRPFRVAVATYLRQVPAPAAAPPRAG